MAQVFHRSTNTIARVSIYGGVFGLAFLIWVFTTLDHSSYNTGQGVTLLQPVPFSHNHHVTALGIDCRYCHTTVETAAYAGMPPTSTCINCHKLIWNDSPMLEPVRESLSSGAPIAWTKINDLPDYVYFDHSVHVTKGVGCASCHGRVDRMPLLYQATTLQMDWCLDCHWEPEKQIRPRNQVFNMAWEADDPARSGAEVVAEYGGVHTRTSCSTCHR